MIRQHYIQTLTTDLEDIAVTLQLKIVPLLKEGNNKQLDSLIKDLGRRIDTRITIMDPEGLVLADSEQNPEFMENHSTRPEILKALYGETGTALRYSTTVKEGMLYVAIPIKEQGKSLGVLRVSLFLKQINSLLNGVKMNFLKVAIVLILLSLATALFFARSLSIPIKELVHASSRVASGDFDVKVYLKSKGELQKLAESFNEMVMRIKELVTELSQQKESLNVIIRSITEGLMVLDKKGKILLGNDSFKKITNNQNILGKYYWEVIREPDLGELIKKTGREKSSLIEELGIGDRTFICSATFLRGYDETVVTMHDITKIKGLERIKKDFVVNVSHELRTPLTAIKGFMETIEDLVDDKERRYVEIVLKHTERLINIVGDLLTLSELEGSSLKLELEEVDLGKLVEDILNIYEKNIREKDLNVVFESEDNLGMVEADPYKLEQMFINLIENAIRYTEEGEIKISLRRGDKEIIIEVADTGIGIPPKYLPRIFERFYVVDKSRSRKLGGTGLGLSIVKHIVLLHNGKIDVKSVPGRGTTFIIRLPLKLGLA
ncbi:HAMP domain-containing protein [candidate division WOR-3 bacterium]|nr:HAMP domain-containing protein [candidate division WOR-3 bacterium]